MRNDANGVQAASTHDPGKTIAGEYPSLWQKVIDEWQTNSTEDAAWLTYSANYLFHTCNVRWALDPYFLLHRIHLSHLCDLSEDLAKLELVVLSHAHKDHFDVQLIHALRDLPIRWVIPEFMLDLAVERTGLHRDSIIIPSPGNQFHINGLKLTPFDALHYYGDHGIPEMGYLAEFDGKRWLFPGDTRQYDCRGLPDFGRLDGVFAHLWLGKGCALQETPPHLEEFYAFFSHLQPARLVIAHLQEIGREKEDFWDLHHYAQVSRTFQQNHSRIELQPALTGKKIIL